MKKLRSGERKQTCGSVLDESGNLLSEQPDILNRWKVYFEGLLEARSVVNENSINGENSINSENSMNLGADEIRLSEVLQAVKRLKNGKAAGVDEIRAELIKESGMTGVVWLHRIINLTWRSGEVPLDWQSAIISPIHKEGCRKNCNNYRGISPLSVAGKLYASIIEKRVRACVEEVLDENQCGFRPMRNCQDQNFLSKADHRKVL